MEKIRTRRRAKPERPCFPKLRSQYGAKHSFSFNPRVWLNFKLYFIVMLVVAVLAVVTVFVLPAAELNTDNLKDTFYTYDENVAKPGATNAAENGATAETASRRIGGGDIVLFAGETHTHTWTETSRTTTEGDCMHNSVIQITEECTCGEVRVYTETVPASHKPQNAVVENKVDATCLTGGHYDSVVYCGVEGCGIEISREQVFVAPTGHTPNDEPVVENRVEPTSCTDAGSYDLVVKCETCSAEISRSTHIIPAKHVPKSPVTENDIKATCDTNGSYDSVVYCEKCNTVLERESVIVAAMGHNPKPAVKEYVIEPTCTETGKYDSVIYCANAGCGIELHRDHDLEAPALGHTFADPCLDADCGACDYVRIPPNHTVTYDHVVEYIAPNCTEDGLKVLVPYCTVCETEQGEKYEITEPAVGHEFSSSCDPKCDRPGCDGKPDMIIHVSSGPVTCTDDSVCANCNVVLIEARGHVRNGCRDELCIVCNETCDPLLHVDLDGDNYCDIDTCMAKLRTFNVLALLYWIFLPLLIVAAAFFLGLNVYFVVKAIKVSTMRVEIYDEVIVWKWGLFFKRHTEKRFVGVYDVMVMPANKYYYKDRLEKKKPKKYGTVLAKVPGGGYEWNLKFYGVREYTLLKNYLEAHKITERFERPRSNLHDDSI